MTASKTNNTKKITHTADAVTVSATTRSAFPSTDLDFPPERTIEYFGTVNYATNDRILNMIREKHAKDPDKELCLIVTSTGGPTGTAMSFHDTIRFIWKLKLTTIASGDVDSSGILIFLAGEKRYVTKHTTLLLHLAGRMFEPGKRFTREEIEAMTNEDRLKDEQYASAVAERSLGLGTHHVLQMMKNNTILTPAELVRYGLAQSVLN